MAEGSHNHMETQSWTPAAGEPGLRAEASVLGAGFGQLALLL